MAEDNITWDKANKLLITTFTIGSMALPINIEELLNKRRIESNRIEFKASWNPDKIYHTICAFATDLENMGGGYILVGVEEEKGIAKRPVKGIAETVGSVIF